MGSDLEESVVKVSQDIKKSLANTQQVLEFDEDFYSADTDTEPLRAAYKLMIEQVSSSY